MCFHPGHDVSLNMNRMSYKLINASNPIDKKLRQALKKVFMDGPYLFKGSKNMTIEIYANQSKINCRKNFQPYAMRCYII